jgi:hypothetical protein
MARCDRHPKLTSSLHVMHDQALARRATAGDDDAWLAFVQRLILEEMCTDPEGQCPSMEISLGDDLRLYFRESDGVIKLFLEICPRISFAKIKAHWAEITAWRDRLLTWQGPWLTGGKDLLGLELHTRHAMVNPIRT